MSRILLVDDDPELHQLITPMLTSDGHAVLSAPSGEDGLEILAREPIDLVLIDCIMPKMDGMQFLEQVRRTHTNLRCIMITDQGGLEIALGALRRRICDLLVKPFTLTDLRTSINTAMDSCPLTEVELVSAQPNWIQLRIPCDLAVVPVLQRLLSQLKNDLPEVTREAIAYAFREMLNNAIEHGGRLDPSKQVEVTCIRLKRAIIYWIKDPGEGFDPEMLEHAAVNNPAGDPFRHISVRDEKGLRAGGFGILLTHQLVDELVYNERRNELIFVKYL